MFAEAQKKERDWSGGEWVFFHESLPALGGGSREWMGQGTGKGTGDGCTGEREGSFQEEGNPVNGV